MFANAARGAWLCALAILLLLGLAMALARPASAQTEAQRFSMEVVGEGPDVILIPGLSMPRETWDGTVEALSDEYRFHLLQVRGFGEPAGINAEGSPILEPLVDELAAYIEAEGLDDPAVVGHSMGGLIALMLASEYSDAPGRLVIVDALPWVGVLYAGAEANVEMIQPQIDAIRKAMLAAAENPLTEQEIAMETRGIAREEDRRTVAEWMRRADRRVTTHTFYDDVMADLRDDVARISVPLTVLVPWSDGIPGEAATLAMYRSQYAEAPDAELVGIAQSGHFLMLDQPEAYLAALEAALAN